MRAASACPAFEIGQAALKGGDAFGHGIPGSAPAAAMARIPASPRWSGSGRGPRRRNGAVMLGRRTGGERFGELRGGLEPGRPERGKSRPFFYRLRIGGEPGYLALPKRDPVFRKLFDILGASHGTSL